MLKYRIFFRSRGGWASERDVEAAEREALAYWDRVVRAELRRSSLANNRAEPMSCKVVLESSKSDVAGRTNQSAKTSEARVATRPVLSSRSSAYGPTRSDSPSTTLVGGRAPAGPHQAKMDASGRTPTPPSLRGRPSSTPRLRWSRSGASRELLELRDGLLV